MRFLIRIVVIAVVIALALRIIRAALRKGSGVEVIPPQRGKRVPQKRNTV
jgi:hypothetical protein